MKIANYYFAHEGAYKQIQAKGGIAWGNIESIEKFRDPGVEEYLTSMIPKLFSSISNLKALDIGCGTGPSAHMLCDLGFDVLGIDVSKTAIEMAQNLASGLKKAIQFRKADLLELMNEGQKFNLLYDSHCFHCIVHEDDRRNAFKTAHALLGPGGYFILDTMAYREGADMRGGYDTLRFDDDYILWHKTQKNNFAGIVELEGQLWCPQRRIYPVEKILSEVEAAGFKVEYRDLIEQEPNECYGLKLVCSRA